MLTFEFNNQTLRTVELDGEPWFVAADVCCILSMSLSHGTTRWLAGLAGDEKQNLNRTEHPQIFCGSRAPRLTAISESGLYKLTLRSTKPEARQFQDWVTREVLPSIRKTGGYMACRVPGAV